jgi:hypothetical protein
VEMNVSNPTPENASSTEDTDRGVVLDILQDPETVEVVTGCCTHFMKAFSKKDAEEA